MGLQIQRFFDEQKNVVFANPLDINIWIPSVDRANNISTIILDNVNYEEFTLNSIFYRTIRKEYVYAVHVNGNEDFTDVEKFGKSDKYNRKLNKFEN